MYTGVGGGTNGHFTPVILKVTFSSTQFAISGCALVSVNFSGAGVHFFCIGINLVLTDKFLVPFSFTTIFILKVHNIKTLEFSSKLTSTAPK